MLAAVLRFLSGLMKFENSTCITFTTRPLVKVKAVRGGGGRPFVVGRGPPVVETPSTDFSSGRLARAGHVLLLLG